MLNKGTKVRIANDPVHESGTIIGYAEYKRTGRAEGQENAYIVELDKGGYLSYDMHSRLMKRNVFISRSRSSRGQHN